MGGVKGLLLDRRFRLFLSARTVSVFGSGMAPIALSFAVLGLDGQATELGVVLSARMLAQILFVLYGGVLADRFSRQRTMVLADLAAAASQALIATLLIAGQGTIGALIVLAFLNGVATAMFEPAAEGVLPLLLPPVLIKDARAMLQSGENAARILGTAGAGFLVVLAGSGWALMIDAGTFLVSALLLSRLGLPPVERAERNSLLADLRGGLRELTSREWMWVSLLQISVMNFCISGGVFVLGPVIAAEQSSGALGWSAVIGMYTIGFLVGSLLALRVNPRLPMRAATALSLGMAVPVAVLALDAPIWALAVAMFVTGVSTDVAWVLSSGVTMTRIPEEALSRVGAFETLAAMVLVPIGFASVGPISAIFGVQQTLGVYALIMVVVTMMALSNRSVRTVTMAT